MTFHFVLFKIPSFACVIGFSFIPNIHTIDNKVEEEEKKRDKIVFFFFLVERGFEPWPLTWMLFLLLYLHSKKKCMKEEILRMTK